MTDIFLDSSNLNGVTWRWFGEYTYTDIEITPGKHSVTSTGDKKLAVYVYSHSENGGGFGYSIWPDGTCIDPSLHHLSFFIPLSLSLSLSLTPFVYRIIYCSLSP